MSKREPGLEAYLNEAAGWDADRVKTAERSVKRAWIVASVAFALACMAVGALALLTPFKSVQPFVIRVDNTSGVVDVVPVYEGTSDIEPLVTRALLTQYVIACERYFYAMAEADYETCGAFNSPQRNQELLALWNRNNPQSPLNVYKDGTTVRVQVRSVSFIKRESGTDDLAQVRFMRVTRPGGSGVEQPTYWIATIQYTYTKPATDEKLRSLNPLGFRVIDYRKEPEVAPEAPPAAATSKAKP